MGEIADGLINGDFDFYTGEYIGKGYGIPRTLNRSLAWEQKNFTQSKEIAFKGISKFLKRRLSITDITPIVNEYMPEATLFLKQKCLAIQKDFGAFVQFINQRKNK